MSPPSGGSCEPCSSRSSDPGDLLDRLSPGQMLPPDPADRSTIPSHHPLSTRAGRLPELHPRGHFWTPNHTGVRIALQRLLHLQSEAVHARRMSVWPVAIHTARQREWESSPRQCFITPPQIRINGAGNTQATPRPNSSSIAACPPAPWAVS